MWLKVICKYLALYFDLWSKLYYIYLNFHSSENITLQSKISLRKQYNLPLGKYSCGVAINPYRYATKFWEFFVCYFLSSILIYGFLPLVETYAGRIILPLFNSSSILCALQPAILETANIGVKSSTGNPNIL